MTEGGGTVVKLLAEHIDQLHAAYKQLSSQHEQLASEATLSIETLLSRLFDEQDKDVKERLTRASEQLDQSWKRIADWRSALGEPALKRPKNTDPLDLQCREADKYLDGMKARMQERGETIIRLGKKLDGMRDALGQDWFQVKLDNVSEGWEALDLRLERMSALEREVVRAEGELARRRKQLTTDIKEVLAVRAELGISSSGADDDMDALDEAMLAHEGAPGKQRKELAPTLENLERVAARRTWLEGEKDTRNAKIQATYDKLYPLWEMLGVTSDEMDAFVNKWCGSTLEVVQAYQEELNRMLSLRRTNLAAFIQHERSILAGLYDALYLSHEEREAMFPDLTIPIEPELVWNAETNMEEAQVNENVSEDLLAAHEEEKARLEGMVASAQDVLSKLARYFDVLQEMQELEASAADPNRLLGKATRGDPGRLLREEKARKRIAKEKPKLEAELRVIIPEWEMQNNRAFTVNGSRFIDDLEMRIEAEEATRKKPKGTSIPPTSSARPLRPQQTGTRSAPPGSVVPLKRQMTGASASSASTSTSHRTAAAAAMASTGPGPAAKKQTPMTTGGAARSVMMHDVANTTMPTPTPHHRGHVKPLAAQQTGMRIPAGFGASSSSSLQTPRTAHR